MNGLLVLEAAAFILFILGLLWWTFPFEDEPAYEVWDGLTGELIARFPTREEAERFIDNDENLSIHQPPREEKGTPNGRP